MRAAFDTVWRDGLWHKLQTMGIPHKLIRILREVYSHGKFRVVANGESGPDVEAATAGVLQGDVLSPDLFKAFINDLPQFLANAGCTGVNVSDARKAILLSTIFFCGAKHKVNSSCNWMLSVTTAACGN
jgi:hypothetical protein